MPNLPDRMEREAEIAEPLAAALARARQQVEAGIEPDWLALRIEIEATLRPTLEDVFIAAYLLLIDDQTFSSVAQFGANSWAADHARAVSSAAVERIRTQLGAGRDIEKIFSPARAEDIAATEVTRATSAAENEARRRAARSTPPVIAGGDAGGGEAYWQTAEDERVCPICQPLNGEPESVWMRLFPKGPPAHPRCRCDLIYK